MAVHPKTPKQSVDSIPMCAEFDVSGKDEAKTPVASLEIQGVCKGYYKGSTKGYSEGSIRATVGAVRVGLYILF